ncbi:MAG: retropepsin-like domain-containing protein [Planctomycetes bacterium]|nr:retropepsin-like domain-containing protein [Planctomycetota bacterium]MCB9892503.1 retropepsin-like domain-containing protein [Planctomycetota bacterium]
MRHAFHRTSIAFWLASGSMAVARGEDHLVEGSARYLGTEARFTLQYADDGRFAFAIEGPIPERTVFDGKDLWNEDWNGTTRRLTGWDVRTRLAQVWVMVGIWQTAKPSIELSVSRDGEGPTLIFPDHGPVGSVELDGHGVIVEIEFLYGRSRRWTFEPAERDAGTLGAWRARRVGGEDTFTIERKRRVPIEDGAYTHRSDSRSRVTFDEETAARIDLHVTPTGHWLVRPRLDGHAIGWFLLDTGATHACISTHVAEELALPAVGSFGAEGIGGHTSATLRRVGSFELGPMQWEDARFVAFDLGSLERAFGVELAGVLGEEFFRRVALVVAPVAKTVDILDPRHELDLDGVAWTPLAFHDRQVSLVARFEGDHTGAFRLDTGDEATVTFHTPTVDALHLLEGRSTRPSYRRGPFGEEPARRGELAWFEVLGTRRENLPVFFGRGEHGVHADERFAGTIGLGLLDGSRIVLDYGRARLGWSPRG